MTAHQATQTRRIKVNYIFYDYKPKNASPYAVTPRVPWIQLKGKWLETVGFSIDTAIKVEVSQGCLVLRAEVK